MHPPLMEKYYREALYVLLSSNYPVVYEFVLTGQHDAMFRRVLKSHWLPMLTTNNSRNRLRQEDNGCFLYCSANLGLNAEAPEWKISIFVAW